jgi:hypothetical protein
MWIRLIWLRIDSSGGLSSTEYEPFGFIKAMELLD